MAISRSPRFRRWPQSLHIRPQQPFTLHDPDGQFAWVVVVPLFCIAWGSAGTFAVSVVTAEAFCVAVGTSALAYCAYKADQWYEQRCLNERLNEDDDEEGRKLPYNGEKLGEDPSVCPQEGFKWRGRGKPGSREGGYFNEVTGESLRPDFHTPGHKPHWDYEIHNEDKARLNTDGTWEWK